MEFNLKIVTCVILLSTIVTCSQYTPEEKTALRQIREKLSYMLYEPYMRTDFYLINFLRARRLDINGATEMLKKAQNWRITKRMDKVLNETDPWNDLLKVLPYRTDGVDKSGSPLIELPVGKWDTRKMVLAGKGELYVDHITRMFEDAFQKIRKAHGNNADITQWQILYDLSGYNAKQHACLACIPRQTQFVAEYEAYFPQRMKTAWIVNTPRIFENLLKILKTVMSQETQRALQIHGLDKSEWSAKIHREIDPSQLLPIFGGTKV